MPDRVAIFIDGAYLDYVLRDELGGSRIDYAKLASALTGGDNLLRSYYYHCAPYQSNPPTPEESVRYGSKRKFFASIDRLPRYTVRLGMLAKRLGPDGAVRYEQKRVDILLGVDLVLLAAKQQIQKAILIAGDSDFIPAVTVAKSEGVVISLFHGARPHNDLWQEADERARIDTALISQVLL